MSRYFLCRRDTTRIQAGKLELRTAPADLNIIVRYAVEEQRQLAPTRVIHLELVADGMHIVNVDADRRGQILASRKYPLTFLPEKFPLLSPEGIDEILVGRHQSLYRF